MNLSNLIADLQAALAQHGDLPVYVTKGEYWPNTATLRPANHSQGREWLESIELELT